MLEYLDIEDKDVKLFHIKIMNNVKKLRKEKNISQTELAQTIGHKSVSTIGQIESTYKNKHYNIEQLYKISVALNVDISEFFK
ncbi:MAG: XRE family transcriptional regulator [Epsilonproteobacteria bacterium]|nr:MAG: XRE family transcriptional regulator [Campylobacterota bacterium]